MKDVFPSYKLIEEYFYKNYSLAYSWNKSLNNCFEKHNSNYLNSFENIFNIEPIYFKWNGFKFPVFIHQNENDLFTKEGKISFDIFLNTFLFLSGWQETICKKKDKHNRFPYEESLQKKHNFVELPVVNIYFELMYELSFKNDNSITKIKYSNPFILTHDIDQFRSAWFENVNYEIRNFSLKSLYKIPFQVLKKVFRTKDSYYKGMQKMLEIDKQYNVKAISFLIPIKSHKDADFELTDNTFKKIISKTCNEQTIGIHPGYYTFNNKKEYLKQIDKLEKVVDKKISKSRQHFLRYDINITPFIQDKIGILEDYTLGFAEQYGFRNGIANSFYLFNFKEKEIFKVLQIPLVFMDVSLMHYSLEKDFDSVISFLERMKNNFNCNFSILFHNSVFTKEQFNGFTELYLKIIKINF